MFPRLLRGAPKTRNIPVMVLSGSNKERDIASARALGEAPGSNPKKELVFRIAACGIAARLNQSVLLEHNAAR